METTEHIAKHFREVNFGGNWTASNLKGQLADVTWQQATTKIHDLNTIAVLVFHINYYVDGVLEVFKGKPLNIKDKYSFNCPPITSEKDWEALKSKTFKQAELFADFVEKLPENKLLEDFTDKKYGNYYRNLHGIIEHCHYHLGQIAIIKKIINNQ